MDHARLRARYASLGADSQGFRKLETALAAEGHTAAAVVCGELADEHEAVEAAEAEFARLTGVPLNRWGTA